MPYLVNGQLVSEDCVRGEEVRLPNDPQWRSIADEAERARRLRAATEFAVVDTTLVEQIAASDPRPLDPVAIERELQKQRAMGSCRSAHSERDVRLVCNRTPEECSTRYSHPNSLSSFPK
jgi:hypothetical protein